MDLDQTVERDSAESVAASFLGSQHTFGGFKPSFETALVQLALSLVRVSIAGLSELRAIRQSLAKPDETRTFENWTANPDPEPEGAAPAQPELAIEPASQQHTRRRKRR